MAHLKCFAHRVNSQLKSFEIIPLLWSRIGINLNHDMLVIITKLFDILDMQEAWNGVRIGWSAGVPFTNMVEF